MSGILGTKCCNLYLHSLCTIGVLPFTNTLIIKHSLYIFINNSLTIPYSTFDLTTPTFSEKYFMKSKTCSFVIL